MLNFTELLSQFQQAQDWQARYRLLIQLSRQLPVPSESELAQWQEIVGCESRLWFVQHSPRRFGAYSEARLMQGILAVLLSYLHTLTDDALAEVEILPLLEQLQIKNQLSHTRLQGLLHIQSLVRLAAKNRSI